MTRLFNLDFQLLHDTILMAISVFVLFTVMSYNLFEPVRKMLKGRQEKIKTELESAASDQAEAAELRQQYEEKLKNVDKEAEVILSEARTKALRNENRIIGEAKEEAARYLSELTNDAQSAKEELEKAQKFLSGYPELTEQLSKAARAKRVNQHTNPAYRWVALAIVLAGAAALVYGIISWRNGGDFGMYFALFGFAAIFFFSGAHVLPTAKNNKKAVARAWEEAQGNLAHVLPDDFPLPARYAHPVVLTRMIRILREGRAQSADEALEVLKTDLKALNADVQVSQEEYDEVVAIKSMFLLSDYQ